MANDNVNVQIGADLIAPIVQAKVNAAIVEAIGDKQAFVESVVAAMLKRKVDSEGKVNSYHGSNTHNMVDWLCRKAIQDAVKEGLESLMQESKPMIKAAIVKQLKSRPGMLAKALVDGFGAATANRYRVNIAVTLPEE